MKTKAPGAVQGHRKITRRTAVRGISLIELLVVVTVIGILVQVVYPSYTDHLRKARRADAQTALLELGQHLERHYSENGTYTGASLPFDHIPRDGENATYTLAFFDEVTPTRWTLAATPRGRMADDRCGNLYLDHTGRRSQGGRPTNPTDGSCWGTGTGEGP